jgi:hypothetical protein
MKIKITNKMVDAGFEALHGVGWNKNKFREALIAAIAAIEWQSNREQQME